jgi:hydrogenase expression/formation protein HypC
MCVALPGKVLEINEKTAVIDFSGNQVTARTGLVEVQVGDYVLVHAGCVIQKVTPQDAEDLTELMKDVKTMEF